MLEVPTDLRRVPVKFENPVEMFLTSIGVSTVILTLGKVEFLNKLISETFCLLGLSLDKAMVLGLPRPILCVV